MSTWKGEFTGWLQNEGRRPLTVAAYCQDIELYERWFVSHADQAFTPAKLLGMDMRAWREHSLNVERVGPATWNRRRSSLRVFCSWALAAKYVVKDPFDRVEPADMAVVPPINWLNDNEFNRVCRELQSSINTARTESKRQQAIRNRAIMALMLFGGLRDGEVVKVWREDLLLTDRTGAVRVRAGKGDKYTGEGGTPIHYEGTIWIKDWLEVRGDESGPLFAGDGTEYLSTRQVQRFVHELGLACGIADFNPHRARHTFVKRTLDGKYRRDGKTVPLNYVKTLARHANISTTARYGMPGRDDLEMAVGA
jgi:integrase/recombinase XerC